MYDILSDIIINFDALVPNHQAITYNIDSMHIVQEQFHENIFLSEYRIKINFKKCSTQSFKG